MRDFSWKVFTMTGDVDAYMLYKESDKEDGTDHSDTPWEEDNMEDYELM